MDIKVLSRKGSVIHIQQLRFKLELNQDFFKANKLNQSSDAKTVHAVM